MSSHHTKDHNGNKGLPFVMSSLVLGAWSLCIYMSVNCKFCYVYFPKPKSIYLLLRNRFLLTLQLLQDDFY